MLIQERLQLILKMHNISPSSFADKLGVQRSNVSHVLSGRNKPSLDFLEKIILQFPRVNAHWLITGVMPAGQSADILNAKDASIDENIEEKSKHIEIDPQKETSSDVQNRVVVKIVEFYTDNTFTEFFPTKQ